MNLSFYASTLLLVLTFVAMAFSQVSAVDKSNCLVSEPVSELSSEELDQILDCPPILFYNWTGVKLSDDDKLNLIVTAIERFPEKNFFLEFLTLLPEKEKLTYIGVYRRLKPQDKNSIIELVKAYYDNEYFPYELSVSSEKAFADILGADETKDFFNRLMQLDNKVIATNVASSILAADKKILFEKEIVSKAHQTTKKWAREKYLKAFDNYLFINDFSNMNSKVVYELLEITRGFDFNEFDTFTQNG